MAWQVVLAEGIVLAIVGAFVWLRPGFGARAALQLMGVVLLVTAAVSVWRLLRDQIEPARTGNVGFRAGVGLSVGLITVIGSLVASESDTVTVALAIVLGIGLMLYALAVLAAALLRRQPGSRFPVVAVVIAAMTFLVGLLLVVNGRSIESLKDTFTWLGILLLIVGLGLIGYALVMRSRIQVEPAE